MSRMVPRFTDADPMVLAVEFEGERPLPQPGWCDEQRTMQNGWRGAAEPVGHFQGGKGAREPAPVDNALEVPRGAGNGHSWLDNSPTAAPVQQISDTAHADPLRHNAARLARLAEAWVDNAMGLARSMERLREMHGLLDALERGWLLQLERRERELVGVGMSDKAEVEP